MIQLPTRRRLIARRDALYDKVDAIIICGSVQQLEHVMRQIHNINLKLRSYFIREHEPKEIFEDKKYENDIAQKNPFTFNDIV